MLFDFFRLPIINLRQLIATIAVRASISSELCLDRLRIPVLGPLDE
jgi:hypothetical protein